MEVEMNKQKKYFKVYKPHPNFIQVDFIENNEATGGYIIPTSIYNTKEELATFLKKEGYIELCKTRK